MTFDLQSMTARVRAWPRAEWAAGVACALAGAGLLVWAVRLWPQWEANPDLSHGFLALPAVVLLWRRASEDAAGGRGLGAGLQTSLAAMAGAGLCVASLLATVYAVAMDWSAVPTLFLLSAAAAAGVALAAVLAAGRDVRWIRPGWTVLVMLAVVLLSAPLPPATYARLTMGLQEMITVGVVETLRLFGMPALRMGNVINLGATSVGVEEACSGVRSLVSCVLAGLVLSALLLRSPWRRVVLVAFAAPLALLTNFVRSLALTLLARNGVDIAGAWHDGLGFAVLGVTTCLLGVLAFGLEEKPAAVGTAAAASAANRAGRAVGWRPASGVVLACLALAAGWFGYVAARTEGNPPPATDVPPLAALVPVEADGWRVTTREDLARFSGILQTDHLLERMYSKIDDAGRLTQLTVYVAWWPAGATSVSTVAAHTPEACWPGAGWEQVPAHDGRRDLPLPGGRVAAEAEQRSFKSGDYPQTVWFWHLVAGVPMSTFDPRSWREQLRVFFEQGVRRDQAQAFVRISSNREWAELADDPLVAEVLAGFARLGVPVARAGD